MPSIMLFVLAINDADFLTFVGVVMHNHVVNLSILLGWHCILWESLCELWVIARGLL
jgi:hypothetical protein